MLKVKIKSVYSIDSILLYPSRIFFPSLNSSPEIYDFSRGKEHPSKYLRDSLKSGSVNKSGGLRGALMKRSETHNVSLSSIHGRHCASSKI